LAFNRLKQNVTTAPVLISPDSTKPFHIEAMLGEDSEEESDDRGKGKTRKMSG
jgi:hypothetical protein